MAGDFSRVVLVRAVRPLPLLNRLLVSIETHALCGALAFFAMLGFYPLSVLLISLAKYVLRSPDAHQVVRLAVQSYYPAGQEFLLRNLEASSSQLRGDVSLVAALWIFLGGAGVFIPLEMAFNRLWGFELSRSYWHNQLVGFVLTAAWWAIAVLLVLAVSLVPPPYRTPALWLTAPALLAVAIFLAYRLLPHGHVPGGIVLSAAVLDGCRVRGRALAVSAGAPPARPGEEPRAVPGLGQLPDLRLRRGVRAARRGRPRRGGDAPAAGRLTAVPPQA